VRFLADESCDFVVVEALRTAGHDVTAVVDTHPGAGDDVVLMLARAESRILLTEDKDFGLLAFAGGHQTAGVLLIRFPASARATLGQAAVETVTELSTRLSGSFVVLEPGRARLSRPPAIR
jgi:predicted nuclease of predicted toxin-antitoxin system